MSLLRLTIFVLISFVAAACNHTPEAPVVLPPSAPIVVRTLECSDPLLAKMISRCTLEFFGEQVRSEVAMSDDSQTGIIITGAILKKDVSTGSSENIGSLGVSSAGGFGVSSGKSANYSGTIVEGVTLIATLDGKEIASATYFQAPRKGVFESPQQVARNAASHLLRKLYRLKLVFDR